MTSCQRGEKGTKQLNNKNKTTIGIIGRVKTVRSEEFTHTKFKSTVIKIKVSEFAGTHKNVTSKLRLK